MLISSFAQGSFPAPLRIAATIVAAVLALELLRLAVRVRQVFSGLRRGLIHWPGPPAPRRSPFDIRPQHLFPSFLKRTLGVLVATLLMSSYACDFFGGISLREGTSTVPIWGLFVVVTMGSFMECSRALDDMLAIDRLFRDL
jgi:hypothetical protein